MAGSRPRDLIFTLFGDYLLHRPGAVWVGSLIELLKPMEISEGAVRTTLSRMAGAGWLVSERRGRNSFYELTQKGRRLLEEGEARIFRPSWDEPWDGTWWLVHYSIPEEDRPLRDRLRTRLSWLGCGSLGGGLWITPHDVGDRVEEIAADLGILDNLEVFRGEHRGFSEPESLVAHCWDLEQINAEYEAFIDRHLPEFERYRGQLERDELSREECYVHRFDLVHEYREFPLLDPYLPRPLLPEDWAGDCAAGLFGVLHDLLEGPAEAYVERALELAGVETDVADAAEERSSGATAAAAGGG